MSMTLCRPVAGPLSRRRDPADRRPLPPTVQGLLLDFGGVIYDDTVWSRSVLKLLGRLGLHTHFRCFFHVWQHDYLNAVQRGERPFCEAFAAFLRSAGLSTGQIDEVLTACRARRQAPEDDFRPLPGVRTTLVRLHGAGVRLGLLANSTRTAAAILDRLDRFGLAGLMAAVVSSIDLGRTLPDAECYRAGLEALGLPAGGVAFVGHDAAELAGAAAAGMPTVAFNRDPDAEADVCLGRFEELLDVLSVKLRVAC